LFGGNIPLALLPCAAAEYKQEHNNRNASLSPEQGCRLVIQVLSCLVLLPLLLSWLPGWSVCSRTPMLVFGHMMVTPLPHLC
jgi:hypothetical protein